MPNKPKTTDKLERRFIYELKKLTAEAMKGMDSEKFSESAKSLRELFDSFAIFDELIDPLECYWEIKIAMQKNSRFVDKKLPYAKDFKRMLIHFFVVIEHIYFYEIYGFFSTTVQPRTVPALPVECSFGCLPEWPLEPVVDEHGQVIYKRVVRFYNNNKIRPLCMTISSNPKILEGHNKCKLTDDQVEQLKAFVRKNKDIIRKHYKNATGSCEFIEALKKRNNSK